jgi:hypothetical protein
VVNSPEAKEGDLVVNSPTAKKRVNSPAAKKETALRPKIKDDLVVGNILAARRKEALRPKSYMTKDLVPPQKNPSHVSRTRQPH